MASITEYEKSICQIVDKIGIGTTYKKIQSEIQKIIDEQDFFNALKIINNKGLLPYTKLPSYFGWKKDYYIDYVISLLNTSDKEASELKKIFRNYIVIDE